MQNDNDGIWGDGREVMRHNMKEQHKTWQLQPIGTTWKGVGLYHITLTIPNRQPLLGTLQIPDKDIMLAFIKSTPLGQAVLDCQRAISEHYPQIKVLHYCLMPDHLHTIWYVRDSLPVGIKTAVRGFWQGVKKVGRAYSYLTMCPDTIGVEGKEEVEYPNTIRDKERKASVRETKGEEWASNGITKNRIQLVAKELSLLLEDTAYSKLSPVFSEMPHIQPMGKRRQLPATIRYIDMNPQRLATKRLKPGYLRVQRGVEIACRIYDAVGNITLLHASDYMPVHVRRTMVEAAEHGETQALRDYMNSCILAARRGTIMVSPFISPKERDVQRVLLQEKRSFIYLTDTPIGEYYKPSDMLFDACAAGRILILHPATEDYKPVEEKRPNGSLRIRRSACVALNGLAEEICRLSSISAE